MYKLRWANETGGDWLHDGTKYIDLDLAELTAMMAFDDELVEKEDIVQAIDDDDEIVEEWDYQDFEDWKEQ